MRTKIAFSRFFPAALTVLCLSPSLAYCEGNETSSPPGGGPSGAPQAAPAPERQPSKNNELFRTLRAQCETEVSCGKANGDVCVNAADILISNDMPDEFREMTEAQRVKIALRLLEKGVDSSNLAAGRAYDWYSKTEFFGFGNLGGYTDAYRANELMDLMIKRSYPGGALRKARAAVSFFSLTTPEAEKIESCAVAKRFLAGGQLDSDSTRIANEVLDSSICKNPDQSK